MNSCKDENFRKFIHNKIHSEIRKDHKKYRKFSKKIFLTLGIAIMSILLVTNFIIGSIFSFYRYYNEKKHSNIVMDKIEKRLNSNELIKLEYELNELIYENIYVKLEDNDKSYFDSYSGYWDIKEKRSGIFSIIKMEKIIKTANGEYKVNLLRDMSGEKGFLTQFAIIVVLINILSILIISIISRIMTFKILMPINHIIDTAEKISSENLSQRIMVFPVDDELSRLSKVINSMIDRLEKAFNLQKKFVSDASHELRTPLQIIKGYTDLILQKGFENEALAHEALAFIKEEADNMIDLTESLLFMAKSEKIELNIDEIELYNFLDKIKNSFTLIYPNIDFEIKGDKDLVLNGDKVFLQEALRAVIDNSIKYSNNNAEINLNYYNKGDNFIIEIKDNGIGIESEDLENIFERFYRVDESRSKEINGLGLGLAIVKNIVNLHGGSIDIHSEKDNGTTVKMIFPKSILFQNEESEN